MPAITLLPQFKHPKIYAYTTPEWKTKGWIKIGQTTGDVFKRIQQQEGVAHPGGFHPEVLLAESALVKDGGYFTDKMIHGELVKQGFEQGKNDEGRLTEWFRCTAENVLAIIRAYRQNEMPKPGGPKADFKMRPEQERAVAATAEYFRRELKEHPDRPARYLWNAKMRFGKTFTVYELAKREGWKRVLVLTFKPAVRNAWKEDLEGHRDFDGWQFVSKDGMDFSDANPEKPIVWFGSFQDFLQTDENGVMKVRNRAAKEVDWDCIVLDEYHFGTWHKSTENFIGASGFDKDGKMRHESGEVEEDYGDKDASAFDAETCPLHSKRYLMLSGTPFRALKMGTFIENQIFNWTYGDEQRAKADWKEEWGPNPYAALPKISLMTYRMPAALEAIARGDDMAFELNEFFKAEVDENGKAKFVHPDEVDQWLDMIRGQYMPLETSKLKPLLPFKDVNFKELLLHTLWFLPDVASCRAMEATLKAKRHAFFKEYDVYCCAGSAAGVGVRALELIDGIIRHPLGEDGVKGKSITLTCGKLTTGVTVKPWSGIFMLRSTQSPETYFQAAFRVQNPWVVKNLDGTDPNKEDILKPECFVFDFAPDRALRQIADYSANLAPKEKSPEEMVKEFINFFPIICFDGSVMRELNAGEILEWAMSGTTATLLARKWNSFLLVNVTDAVFSRIQNDEKIMKVLEKIDAFANIRQDIDMIINQSEALKKAKRKAMEREPTARQREKMSEAEKALRKKRKEIQEKLVKFAIRIPIFMYLTDRREQSLMDLIRESESDLFAKVTGLSVADFNLLVDANLFDEGRMNQGILGFRCYERGSYEYLGKLAINEKQTHVGAWNFSTGKANIF